MSLEDYLTIFNEIISNLETLEGTYDEKDLRLILLCSLPYFFVNLRILLYINYDILITLR